MFCRLTLTIFISHPGPTRPLSSWTSHSRWAISPKTGYAFRRKISVKRTSSSQITFPNWNQFAIRYLFHVLGCNCCDLPNVSASIEPVKGVQPDHPFSRRRISGFSREVKIQLWNRITLFWTRYYLTWFIFVQFLSTKTTLLAWADSVNYDIAQAIPSHQALKAGSCYVLNKVNRSFVYQRMKIKSSFSMLHKSE